MTGDPQLREPERNSRIPRVSIGIIAAAAVIATLYFGREVFIPLALSILLSFLLAPLATRLQRWKLPQGVAVLLTCTLAFSLLGGLLTVVGYQFVDLVEQVPQYEKNLRSKIRVIRSPWSSLRKTTQTVDELRAEWQKTAGRPPEPVAKVQVLPSPPNTLQLATDILGPILKPIGSALVVIVLVVFALLERASLRDRLIALVGARDLYTTTQALDEASNKVTRYLLMQTIINTVQGIAVAFGLYLIGIPNAILWGTLSMALRFLPYVGPWVAAAIPIALSFAVFNDWMHPLVTFGLYALLELITANFVEPLLYGSGTGVSPFTLLVAAAFWTMLWGVPGLLLAVPLTVCLFVAGKYMNPLRFFSVMLGEEPVLEHYQRVYQRLLAQDEHELEQILRQCMTAAPPIQCLDRTVIPMLQLAQNDLTRGVLAAPLHHRMLVLLGSTLHRLHETLSTQNATIPPARSEVQVLCVAVGDETDFLIAELLAAVLEANGIGVATVHAAEVGQVTSRPAFVWLCALPPTSLVQAHQLCKHVRKRFTEATVGVGLWDADRKLHKSMERMRMAGAQRIATSLSRATQMTLQTLRPGIPAPGNISRTTQAEPVVLRT